MRQVFDDEDFMPARAVWERYGVTYMSLHRWVKDERMNFPKPVYLGRFRYWKVSELKKWESTRDAPVAGYGPTDKHVSP